MPNRAIIWIIMYYTSQAAKTHNLRNTSQKVNDSFHVSKVNLSFKSNVSYVNHLKATTLDDNKAYKAFVEDLLMKS